MFRLELFRSRAFTMGNLSALLAALVDKVQRGEGYRLVGIFEDDPAHALAVAGFRVGHMLMWGLLPLRRRSLDPARSAPPRLRQTATRLAGRRGRTARV